MTIKPNQIPFEEKWAMAARGLTAAMVAHLDALHKAAGKAQYTEIIRQIWTQIGQGAAADVERMGMETDNAWQVAEAGVTFCMCAMGPEYQIEELEASEDRAVMKITECPWNNRMGELGISEDLLSACDRAFWSQFVYSLNPEVTMKHGKQMHCGDPYCEWIFEKKAGQKSVV